MAFILFWACAQWDGAGTSFNKAIACASVSSVQYLNAVVGSVLVVEF
ncbi:hypothetical protein AAHH88_00320 [Candidatus Hodgkinia cicadicola]